MCEASRTFPRFLREKSHRRNENKNWIAFQPNRCCNDCCWSIEFGLSSNRVKCIQKLIDSVGVLFSIRFPSIFLRTYFKIRETKSLAFGLGYKTATFPWKWNKFRDRNEFIACSEYCWPLKILQSNKRRLHLSHNKIVYLAAHIWFITTGRCCMEKMENIVFVSVYTRFVFLPFFSVHSLVADVFRVVSIEDSYVDRATHSYVLFQPKMKIYSLHTRWTK